MYKSKAILAIRAPVNDAARCIELFHVLFCLMCYCSVCWVWSPHLGREGWLLYFSFVYNVRAACRNLFTVSL